MLQLAGEVVAKLSSLGHVENINKEDQNFILFHMYTPQCQWNMMPSHLFIVAIK